MQGTSQNAPKLNAGLNLKFNKTNKEVRHNVNSEYTMMHCDRMSGHLATSEMWCWSGARRILTELSLCYSIVYRYSVVVSGSSPVSSTHHWSNNRLIYCDAICNSSWPWHLRHLVPVNAVISNGLFCNASLFYVSCVQSGGRYQLQCSSRLLLCSIGLVSLCLFGLPANLIQRLQSVQNAAARLIFRIRRSEHIISALISLHWLRVPECISFKLAVLTYQSIHGIHLATYSHVSPVSPTWHQDDSCGLLLII